VSTHPFNSSCLHLYLITDRSVLPAGQDLCTAVAQAIDGGVTVVQLREKGLEQSELTGLARQLHAVTAPRGVPLIINDDVDVMLAVGAEGVHVGIHDAPVAEARRLAGNRIVGATAKSREQIRQAFDQGADYVGVGPVFPSGTKPDAGRILGPAGLAELTENAPLPCVAIGGIDAGNACQLAPCPIAGICTVRGILGQPDISGTARKMADWRKK